MAPCFQDLSMIELGIGGRIGQEDKLRKGG